MHDIEPRQATGALTAAHLEVMPLHLIRLSMAVEGWSSKVSLDFNGWGAETGDPRGRPFGVSCWFERWDWHGSRSPQITIGCHGGPYPDQQRIANVVLKAAARALDVWNRSPTAMPGFDQDGSLVAKTFETGLWQQGLQQQSYVPQEMLPANLADYAGRSMIDHCPIMEQRLGLIACGVATEDEITWMSFNPGPDRNGRPRDWGHRMTGRLTTWHGERIPGFYLRSSGEYLGDVAIAGAFRGMSSTIDAMKSAYPAGGPRPPSMFSFRELAIEEEKRIRAREDLTGDDRAGLGLMERMYLEARIGRLETNPHLRDHFAEDLRLMRDRLSLLEGSNDDCDP